MESLNDVHYNNLFVCEPVFHPVIISHGHKHMLEYFFDDN